MLGFNPSIPNSPITLAYKEAAASAAAKAMKNELDALISSKKNPTEQKGFAKQMDDFNRLFLRYLEDKRRGVKIDWSKIKSPAPDQVVNYDKLDKLEMKESHGILDKLAVLKLNGGLGTTMGCVGPKSAIEVRDGMTFLDLIVHQIEYINKTTESNVPLVLMNSFNTDYETGRIVKKYVNHNIKIMTFNQSCYPRINKDSLLPLPRTAESMMPGEWYPPGHGDLFESLYNSGLLDQLIDMGKEYLFVANVDNLGAIVDMTILNHMMETNSEFLMEVTDKTMADVKGGTLIDYDGQIRLLEIAQVPSEYVDTFKSIKKFKIFNTNNIWVSLKAIKRVVMNRELNLEIIVNNKTTDNGTKIIQLETAVGAAIKHFKNAHGVNVPRSRFLPVKSTSDLFLVISDLYRMKHGILQMNPQRPFTTVPLVKLGESFKKVNDFLVRFKSPPHILELDHLTVSGDVTFGSDVTLKGSVIIVANHGSRIDIPSGSILENKVVSGNLRILDH